MRIIEAVQCDVPLEILLGVGRFDAKQLVHSSNGHQDNHETDPGHKAKIGHETEIGHETKIGLETNHGQAFSTWSYKTDQPLSLDALKEMVRRKLPGNIYRCKGVV
ncbi:MAG: GTP-binding protein [Candidatus Promineifilaceae bacterium]